MAWETYTIDRGRDKKKKRVGRGSLATNQKGISWEQSRGGSLRWRSLLTWLVQMLALHRTKQTTVDLMALNISSTSRYPSDCRDTTHQNFSITWTTVWNPKYRPCTCVWVGHMYVCLPFHMYVSRSWVWASSISLIWRLLPVGITTPRAPALPPCPIMKENCRDWRHELAYKSGRDWLKLSGKGVWGGGGSVQCFRKKKRKRPYAFLFTCDTCFQLLKCAIAHVWVSTQIFLHMQHIVYMSL